MLCRVICACALLTAALVNACGDGIVIDGGNVGVSGSGTIVIETREVGEFDRITLAGEGTVIAIEGPAASLSIEADDNLLTHIETSVRGGVLRLATESGVDIEPSDSITYRLTAPDITGVTLAGAGDLQLDAVEADQFTAVLSGAGSIQIGGLRAEQLEVTISGVGRVVIAGEVTVLQVTISGAGGFEGQDLKSVRATVTTSGTGSAAVWVTDTLEATVSGVGSIDYFGTPQVTETVTGLGSVNSRGNP